MSKEFGPSEASPIDLRIVENDRRFLRRMEPIVIKYKEEPVTSINKFWKEFYGVLEEISGFKYTVRRCPRLKQEEVARIEEKDKMILLLAPEIFTPEGLEGLCKVFPLSMSWTTDLKEILNITHNPKRGGCVITERGLDAPFTTRSEYKARETIKKKLDNISSDSKKESIEIIKAQVMDLNITPRGGYSAGQLIEKAKSDGGFGLGISSYMIASKFSQLITGAPLDLDTFVRIPGSTYRDEALAISNTYNGNFHVFKSPPDDYSQIMGVRSGLMIEKDNRWWQSFIRPRKPFEKVTEAYKIA